MCCTNFVPELTSTHPHRHSQQPSTTTPSNRCRHPSSCASPRAPSLPLLHSSAHQHVSALRLRDGCWPLLLLAGMGVRIRLVRRSGGGVVNTGRRALRSLLRGMGSATTGRQWRDATYCRGRWTLLESPATRRINWLTIYPLRK